jgi:hypothetical protein
VVAREVLVVKDTVVARGSPKASSNDFVADERVLEGPADLTIYNGLQIAFYAHLGQADRTFHNRPGSLSPATPSPRIGVSILGGSRASAQAHLYAHVRNIVVDLEEPR